MQPKDFIAEFAKIGLPLIGAALPIPGGAAIGAAIAQEIGAPSSAPADILKTVQSSADAASKAIAFQLRHQETLLRITVDAERAQVEAVNKTLQTDAAGPGYWQRSHHAFECSAFVLMCIGDYFVLPLLHIPTPSIPEFAFMAMGAVLGVTAWHNAQQ